MSNADPTGRGNGPAPDLFDARRAAPQGDLARPASAAVVVPGGENDRDGRGRRMLRWECRCNRRPVLLATIESSGRVNVKLRDRYLRITGGRIEATCPRCGVQHALAAGDLARR
ncbi:MAG: hypothetical protein ACKOWF_08015, partial [Chloroflexota bacterium]